MASVLSGAQCRMARGLLRWSVEDLCKAAGVSSMTIKRVEKADEVPNAQILTLKAIYDAFIHTGRVRFEGETGVFIVLGESAHH